MPSRRRLSARARACLSCSRRGCVRSSGRSRCPAGSPSSYPTAERQRRLLSLRRVCRPVPGSGTLSGPGESRAAALRGVWLQPTPLPSSFEQIPSLPGGVAPIPQVPVVRGGGGSTVPPDGVCSVGSSIVFNLHLHGCIVNRQLVSAEFSRTLPSILFPLLVLGFRLADSLDEGGREFAICPCGICSISDSFESFLHVGICLLHGKRRHGDFLQRRTIQRL